MEEIRKAIERTSRRRSPEKKEKTAVNHVRHDLRDWSNLPDDILTIIFNKLIKLIDKLRAASVCDGWEIAIDQLDPMTTFEYKRYVTSPQDGNQIFCQFKVRQPGKHQNCSVNRIIDFPIHANAAQFVSPDDRHELVYKLGWVLDGLKMRWIEEFGSTTTRPEFICFYLYHPFDEIYNDSPKFLPPLYLHPKPKENLSRKLMATFSCHPMSRDCVVFVVVKLPTGETAINTWRSGQGLWMRHMIVGLETFIRSIVYIDGYLYCVNRKGNLVTFNSCNGSWEVTFPRIEDEAGSEVLPSPKLFALNGELLLHSTDACFADTYKYDASTNAWIHLEEA